MAQFASLRDNFTDNSIAPAWSTLISGSATVAETGGQFVATLPSSTAGSHLAFFVSTSTYDLTADSFYVNIATMVATGVAAEADFDLVLDDLNYFRWRQLSNAIQAYKIIGGVFTQLFTATWSSSTYKYLRIRESGGNILWDSSTNGTSWTNRATLATPFAVTALSVQFGASCGNVASPGTFKLDDVNLILPALSTNWRWTQVVWPLTERFKVVTLALDTIGTAQCYIAFSDSVDVNNDPVTPTYWSGPSDGGRELTTQATQAAAQALAVNIPLDGRLDLPSMVQGRVIRIYHRSIDGSAYTLREFYPRRLIQSDDIEAESIRAINIAAGAITADKISVINLAAVSAQMGALHMDGIIDITTTGGIYQGTGTFASPTTGLKIYNSGGVGKLSTYNATVEQITLDTDGKLKAGAGAFFADASGAALKVGSGYTDVASLRFVQSDGTTLVGRVTALYSAGGSNVALESAVMAGLAGSASVSGYASGGGLASVFLRAQSGIPAALLTLQSDGTTTTAAITASATTISANTAIGDSINSVTRLRIKGASATSSDYALVVVNSTPTAMLAIRNDNKIGFFGATEVSRPTVTGSRAANAALASALTALANLGLITDSSTV